MSKKQLVKDNLIMFIGGNIANAMNYGLNIALFRIDDKLLNLYTAYNSIALLLLIPSQVSLRIFTVFGSSIIENIRRYYLANKNFCLSILIAVLIAFIPLNLLITRYTQEGNFVTSMFLILLAATGFVSYVFRGIRQSDEDYRMSAISINIEAFARVILGLIFAVYMDMGISGIILGHILGLIGSLFICFDRKHIAKTLSHNEDISLKELLFNTTLLTGGLEFFSNFDIAYANHVLNPENDRTLESSQTQFNTLQFFRKIIFFGTFTVSSIILSLGGKGKNTKKFMFFYTILAGTVIGLGSSIIFMIIKKPMLDFLKKDLNLITDFEWVMFLTATTLMSLAYLLANWLYTLKKRRFIFLPVIASSIQLILYVAIGKNLHSLLTAYFVSCSIFFFIMFVSGLTEILFKPKEVKYKDNFETLEPSDGI